MTVCLLKKGCKNLSGLIEDIITRPDDMGEIFSLYGSIKEIPNQLKKGIAKSFTLCYNKQAVYNSKLKKYCRKA